VSAEKTNVFVGWVVADTPEMAMDGCVHKVEQQLRRYKEKVQEHHGAMPQGGTSPLHPDLPEPPVTV
jgi:putative sigma-54 modulation protein